MFPDISLSKAYTSKKETEQLVARLSQGMSIATKLRWGALPQGVMNRAVGVIDRYVLELIPYLLRIVNSPHLKAANIQLMKPDERALVNSIVSRMTDTGLQYRQVFSEEDGGQYMYKLDPYVSSVNI